MEAHPQTRTTLDDFPISLLQLLSNTLVLNQTTPHLPASSLLALGSTSKTFRDLVHNTPNVFRYLDLTKIGNAQFNIPAIDQGGEVWRNVQLDENVTEDDFYGGPLTYIFNTLNRRGILQDVQTLVLDGLSVPAGLVSEIITQRQYNVRILSIRGVSHLNERKLQQVLKDAVQSSRPLNTPKLQALYVFGPKEVAPTPRVQQHVNRYPPGIAPIDTIPLYGVIHSRGAQIGAQWNDKPQDTLAHEIVRDCDKWYSGGGKVIAKPPSIEWAHTIAACRSIISFDAVLCRGPRHIATPGKHGSTSHAMRYEGHNAYLEPRVATHSMRRCHACGTAPEMFSKFGVSPIHEFPLLAPPPLHASTVKAAKTPSISSPSSLLVRCVDCLRGRFCESCHIWWCENCYEVPSHAYAPGSPQSWEGSGATAVGYPETNVKPGVARSCFECGLNCSECIKRTQLMCRLCGGGYCTVHNEGSTLTTCDWCARSGRRTRDMY